MRFISCHQQPRLAAQRTRQNWHIFGRQDDFSVLSLLLLRAYNLSLGKNTLQALQMRGAADIAPHFIGGVLRSKHLRSQTRPEEKEIMVWLIGGGKKHIGISKNPVPVVSHAQACFRRLAELSSSANAFSNSVLVGSLFRMSASVNGIFAGSRPISRTDSQASS